MAYLQAVEVGKPRPVNKKTLLAVLAVVVILAAAGCRAVLKEAATACNSITLIAGTTLDGRALTRVGVVTVDFSPTRT